MSGPCCPECGREHDDTCLIARLIAAIGQRKAVELLTAIRADHLEPAQSAAPDWAGMAGDGGFPPLPAGF